MFYVGGYLIDTKAGLSGTYSIKEGTTSITSQAFSNCYNLQSIVIPDSVKQLDTAVFEKCTSLSSVTIGSGVETIGIQCFADCVSLTEVIYSGDLNNIDVKYGNTILTSL